jgi:histidinol dehydrogenase
MKVLDSTQARDVLARRKAPLQQAEQAVKPILDEVKARGDDALRDYARRFDGFDGSDFRVPEQELDKAVEALDSNLRRSLEVSIANVRRFAELQMPQPFMAEFGPGHRVGQTIRPIHSMAAYVPGGRYPLPSTVVMTCVPAEVAGVTHRWVATPKPNPTVYAAARLSGATGLTLLGGAHAIAAFAFGTETIPKVGRIVGPGNLYVTAAKKLLAGEVGIDFIAGPTEVVIAANEGDAAWIAADLLAQAEHDSEASSIFLTTNRRLAEEVAREVDRQLAQLATANVAELAISAHGLAVVCQSNGEICDLINELAPEHLCLHDPSMLGEVANAGSIFLGPFSPEAAGDYVTGPNHVLPTSGAGHLRAGLSVLDFLKIITVQELDACALERLGPAAATLARAEGLEGHTRSIEVRLEAQR